MSLRYESFKDIESADVYWVGGLVLDVKKNWCVRVYLKNKGLVWYYKMPVGYLPSIFVGAEFNYGRFVKKKFVTNSILKALDMRRLEFVTFSDIPEKLYSSHHNPALKDEVVCKYIVDNKTFYIPQIEIMRAFFGVNSTTLHRLLMPAGLDELFKVIYHAERTIELEFDRNFPKNNVNKAVATLFASLSFEQSLRDFWFSVFLSVKIKKDDRLFALPDITVDLSCVSVSAGTDYLVKKINKIKGLPCPFDDVKFLHPLMDEKIVSRKSADNIEHDKQNASTRPQSGEDNESDIVDDEYSTYDVNRKCISNPGSSVRFEFEGKVNARQQYKRTTEKEVKRRDPVHVARIAEDNDNQRKQKRYSTGISVGEKSEKPVDFRFELEDYTCSGNVSDLDFFIQAVRFIGVKDEDIRIGKLHGRTKFVMLDEYTRRQYVVVNIGDMVLVEFARPDNHPISTLIFKASGLPVGRVLQRLIRSAVGNNGHWDKKYIKGTLVLKCGFVKHMKSDDIIAFSDRLKSVIDRI